MLGVRTRYRCVLHLSNRGSERVTHVTVASNSGNMVKFLLSYSNINFETSASEIHRLLTLLITL